MHHQDQQILASDDQFACPLRICHCVSHSCGMRLNRAQLARACRRCQPWMILVVIAAAIAVLPDLGVKSVSDFWRIANDKIWTNVALSGQRHFTFWHVMFFAWFCNMAMHIGMADLSILRYAKKWYYGFSSAAGRYVGH